jgi:hypothetical protein
MLWSATSVGEVMTVMTPAISADAVSAANILDIAAFGSVVGTIAFRFLVPCNHIDDAVAGAI